MYVITGHPSPFSMPDFSQDPAHGHASVLPKEVLSLLQPQPGHILFDGTLGRGGHASLLIPTIPGGTYIATDLDAGNLAYAKERLTPLAKEHGVTLHLAHQSFADVAPLLASLGITHIHGLLADLGFASNQVDNPARGFSFMQDGPLDMRLNPMSGTCAYDLVNEMDERSLADLIYTYGEERASRKIARKIVDRRKQTPINTTSELAQLCREAYGPAAHRSRIHPATRTFQALRIAVNGELDALDRLLKVIPDILETGGIAALISFHSLEDRPVKLAFRKMCQEDKAISLTRKPVTASGEETHHNPRSRSAKLRAIQKIPPA